MTNCSDRLIHTCFLNTNIFVIDMATYTHIQLYGIIIISLILIFSFIHLGVSIGIINSNRPYGDIFRPEIGLSSYNILISFLGIVVGVAGLIHMLTNQKALGRFLLIF